MKVGADAAEAVAEAGRRSTARRDLARNPRFEQISPELGDLDVDAFRDLFDEDPDAALSLLVDMAGATDNKLRELARSLAARVVTAVARSGQTGRRGASRRARSTADRATGEINLDASLDEIASARATSTPYDPNRLIVDTWARPTTALCLLVDRSGSMMGPRLAAAALAAAAVLLRDTSDSSVVAFADDAIVLKAIGEPRSPDDVVDDLLSLRGSGVTNLALALRVARRQLDRSSAGRRLTVVLSDCRVTTGGDATADAAALDEVVILAPDGDSDDARALAQSVGARWSTISGPTDIRAAFEALFTEV